jgi:hypothetical protein
LERHNNFSETVGKKLGHYVYRLIDPRNGITFYVGRGRRDRVFSHAGGHQKPTDYEDEGTLKLRTIWAIKSAGFEVEHVIHRHGMDEPTAKEVEAALIDAYPGLTNVQVGYDSDRGVMHAEEIIQLYEAPKAEFKHKLILINVNQTGANEDPYDAARYAWRIAPNRANKADFVLPVRKGLIIAAFKVVGNWLPATPKNFPDVSRVGRAGPREGRYGFRGFEAPDEIKHLYLQRRAPKFHGNPVKYVNC